MFMKDPFSSSRPAQQNRENTAPAKNFNLELTLKLSKDQKSQMNPGTPWEQQALVYVLPETNGGGYLLEEKWLSPQQKRGGNGKWSRHTAIYDHPLFEGQDIIYNQYLELEQQSKQFKYGSEERKSWNSKAYQWKYKKLMCLEVVDLGMYHHVPNANNDYTTPYPCEGARCPFCSDSNPDIATRHLGGRRILPLTETEYSQLVAVNSKLGGIVARSDNEAIIGKKANPGVVAIKCENCGTDLVDPNQVKTMKMDIVNGYLSKETRCSDCGHQGRPVEVSLHGEDLIERGSIKNHAILITRSGILGKQGSNQFNITFAGVPCKTLDSMLEEMGVDVFDSTIGNNLSEEVNIANYYAPEGVTPSFYGWDDEAPADQQPNFRADEYVQEVLRRRAEKVGQVGSNDTSPPDNNNSGFSFYRR